MLGDSLALACVTPNSVSGQIHVGAVGWEVLIVNGTMIEVRFCATNPAAFGIQTEPEIGSLNVAIAAFGETLLLRHHRLDEAEIAAIRQMWAVPHHQWHISSRTLRLQRRE